MIRILSLAILLSALFLAASCARGKSVKRSDRELDSAAAANARPGSDTLKPVTKDDLTGDELAQVKKVLKALEDVPFDFDSYTIPTQGMEIIRENVTILNDMLQKRGKYVVVTIEGHTDERGSDEYNLALGERRGKTVRDYLLNVGFMGKQLRIISFGEEKPKVEGNTPESYAANRRVHLTVQ